MYIITGPIDLLKMGSHSNFSLCYKLTMANSCRRMPLQCIYNIMGRFYKRQTYFELLDV